MLVRDIEMALFLLKQGADPDLANQAGDTPLHQAVDSSEPALVKLLLEYRASPNATSADLETPLHRAAYRSDVLIVNTLLSYGACPNVQNKYSGRTPLHYCVIAGSLPCVRLLLRHGADLDVLDKKGQTPLSLADRELAQFLRNPGAFEGEALPVIEEDREDTVCGNSFAQLSEVKDGEALMLLNFLYSLNLEEHFDGLVAAGFDNFDSMLEQMNSPMPINEAVLRKCGITKPGHQKRLLVRLWRFATGQLAEEETQSTCYTSMPGQSAEQALKEWLADSKLEGLFPLFEASGYDSLQYLREQVTSKYFVTDDLLQSEVGIASATDRLTVLGKLLRETDKLSDLGIVSCKKGCDVCVLL